MFTCVGKYITMDWVNKNLLFVFLLLTLLGSRKACSQIWQPMNQFTGSARDDGTRFIINDIAFCGTGLSSTWTDLGDFHGYNMVSNSWSAIASLPSSFERQYACGFSSTTHGYIFGGYGGGVFLNDLWKYDPQSDSWAIQSSLPGEGRSGSAFFTINDTTYIIGGRTNTSDAINEVWAYSMTNDTWTMKNDFPFDSLWRASGISYGQSGYLAFGRSPSNIYHNELYSYSPTIDTWTQLSNFPGVGRTYSVMYPVMGKILIVAGLDSIGESYDDMWQYDTLLGNWSQLASIPAVKRRGGIGFHSLTAIFYTTGIDLTNTRLTETWKCENPTEINENNLGDLKIYPNPFRDILHLESTNLLYSNFTYTVFDKVGRKLLESNSEISTEINLSKYAAGAYIIEISNHAGAVRHKVIKQ